MGRYTITAAGRLIQHRSRLEDGDTIEIRPGVPFTRFRRVPVGEIDMEYHGDVRIYARTPENAWADYVARFTRGSLEWIRPYDTLTEIHRDWLDSSLW